jgi:ACS family glucarate transporter-like MFS transporter
VGVFKRREPGETVSVTLNNPPRGRIAISAIAYLDRVNMSIAGSSIQKEFGLDNTRLGWVFSSFVLGYALFQAPGGRLADRFGPRRILAIATVWWAVFTSLAAMVPAGIPGVLAMLLAVRFLLGVGEAMVFPACNRLVASWIPSQERGLANGLIFAGVGAGAGVTPPLITFILLHYGWRWSFWICAVIGLAAGLVWYLIARDRPEEHTWVKPAETKYIHSGMPKQKAPDGGEALPWSVILASRNVWALTVSYFAFGYVAYIFFTWFFIYLNRVRGLDLKASAIFGMLPFLAMATLSPLGGYISDRLTKRYGKRVGRCGISVVSMALAAGFIVFAMQAHDARVASIVLAGGAGALYLSTSCFWSVTADIAGHSAGSVSGVMNMGNQIGGTVTASLTPVLASAFGWPSSFLVAAALCLLGSLAWLLVDPYRILSQRALEDVIETTR